MRRPVRLLQLLMGAGALVPALLASSPSSAARGEATRSPVYGQHGMVCAAQPLAVQAGLLDGLSPELVGTFRSHLVEALEAGAAEALGRVETTAELGDADEAALLEVLRQLAASLVTPDV